LWILNYREDDPKKCSAIKMLSLNLAQPIENIYRFPPRTILLTPYAQRSISPKDIIFGKKKGIGAIDCSWERAEQIFSKKMIYSRYECRSLPFLLASNPINWGKPFKLSTLEAFSAALYILGYKEKAQDILGITAWGENFISLNQEPLERYSKAEDSTDIIRIQDDYV